MADVHVFFFRGLSTYGHDHAQWTVFNFGPIYKHLAVAFAARGIHFHPVTGMGSGSLPEVAARAQSFIEKHPVWLDPNKRVHFLGHSAGGLVARMVLNSLAHSLTNPPADADKILSCLTIATPHAGSGLARICVDMPERYPGSTRLLRTFGYNVSAKRSFFSELTAERVAKLFDNEPKPLTTRLASIVCHSPRSEWCAPLRLCYLLRAFNDFKAPSDGVVERDSQPFGEVLAEINLDHFRQIGLFGASPLFHQMCDLIAAHLRKSSEPFLQPGA